MFPKIIIRTIYFPCDPNQTDNPEQILQQVYHIHFTRIISFFLFQIINRGRILFI